MKKDPAGKPLDLLPDSDPFQKETLDFIDRHRLVEPGGHILAAVSGGPDSAALLDCLIQLRKMFELDRITVIHFDHQLRGEASTADSEFVQAIAKEKGLPVLVGTDDVRLYQKRHHVSLEMAARACRQNFFAHARAHFAGSKIATGHTGDDCAEEILLRLLRGTGPAGLIGISPMASTGAIRPLLWATRGDVLDYISRRGIRYREDASNQEPFCQRNVLRLKVFPILREHFHRRITRTLTRHAELVRDEEDFWRRWIEERRPFIFLDETPERVALGASALLEEHPALQRRILRAALQHLKTNLLGFYSVHIELLRTWIAKNKGTGAKTIQLPGGVRATSGGGAVVFSLETAGGRSETPQDIYLPIPAPGVYDFPTFRLVLALRERLSVAPGISARPPSDDIAWMDAHSIDWPMSVRNWKPGDRFQPLGCPGTRKLQDFFTDAKVPRSSRREIPILWDRGKICWIVRHRLDDRVKVTPGTELVLVSEVQPR